MTTTTATTDLATQVRQQDQESVRCHYCTGGDLHRASCWALSMGAPLWRTGKPNRV